MKLLLYILLLPLLVFAQPQRMLLNGPAKGSGGVTPFDPTQVPNAMLYLSHLDIPALANPYGWTNEIAPHQVWTNQGTCPNSAAGITFPGTAGNYFDNAASSVPLSNSLCSVWFVFTPNQLTGFYNTFLGAANAGGYGYYLNGLNGYCSLVNGNGAAFILTGNMLVGTQHDVAIVAGSPAKVYLDGAYLQDYAGNDVASYTLRGLGHDYGGDANGAFVLAHCEVSTNYAFTGTDRTNLLNYGAAHP